MKVATHDLMRMHREMKESTSLGHPFSMPEREIDENYAISMDKIEKQVFDCYQQVETSKSE
jgi:hypothetical protein